MSISQGPSSVYTKTGILSYICRVYQKYEENDDNVTVEMIMNSGDDCHTPDQKKARTTIIRLENNKAAGSATN